MQVNFLSAGPQAEAMGLQVSTSLTQTSGSGGDHANIIKVHTNPHTPHKTKHPLPKSNSLLF